MWVVKLGGSLLGTGDLGTWLETLSIQQGPKLAIVPGGGIFADTVREQQHLTGLDDSAAHHMSVLAMEQYGWLCHGLKPHLKMAYSVPELNEIHRGGHNAILVPRQFLGRSDPLPQNWSVTSDSIAAWIARELKAECLVLVKSCTLNRVDATPKELMLDGIVDECFPEIMGRFNGDLRCFSSDQNREFQCFRSEKTTPEIPLCSA